ncbi:MAG: hypothetical protein OXS40_00655 [Gammaproteobacteria bacterium]|nr:hypothetical protein [Gammaproteobacteria bacterium]
MNHDSEHWVEKRAKCTINRIFSDMYSKAIGDVHVANEHIQRSNGYLSFSVRFQNPLPAPGMPKTHFKVTSSLGEGGVDFHIENGEILISPNLKVTKQWNVKKRRCDLYVQVGDESPKKHTMDQILQMALEGLFFD